MEHWESSIKKEQERIQIKFRLLNKFKYIYVNFLDGYGGYNYRATSHYSQIIQKCKCYKLKLRQFWKNYNK